MDSDPRPIHCNIGSETKDQGSRSQDVSPNIEDLGLRTQAKDLRSAIKV